jgi:hypothetical protein
MSQEEKISAKKTIKSVNQSPSIKTAEPSVNTDSKQEKDSVEKEKAEERISTEKPKEKAVKIETITDTYQIGTLGYPDERKLWNEIISLRGYAQIRFNGGQSNSELKCAQCDRSWGGKNEFFVRRARVILSGDVTDRVFIYFQPDFASDVSDNNKHFAQVRDLYFDYAFDSKKEYRIRIGQSKVPYGYENLQSSSNRIPLDRADPTNSGVPNERDLGAMFYYTPAHVRERFASILNKGLKGSGDYGMLGFGVYNGQTANRKASGGVDHFVLRLTYPFLFSNGQIFEPSISGYKGKFDLFSVSPELKAAMEKEIDKRYQSLDFNFRDERVAYTLVWYPQPLGFIAEFTQGRGPEFDPSSKRIHDKYLYGGYFQMMYYLYFQSQTIIPFFRVQYYHGGKKAETDATYHRVREGEIGIEYQPDPGFEIVLMYTRSRRITGDFKNTMNEQEGSLYRVQVQVNF